jgi:hypothetical protein
VVWILKLVKIGAEAEGQAVDVMEINRPGDLGDMADLGLTLAETKRLLARLQQEIVAAQVREHAARRPTCSHCGDALRIPLILISHSGRSRSPIPVILITLFTMPEEGTADSMTWRWTATTDG